MEGLPHPEHADFSLSFKSGSLADWRERLFHNYWGEDFEKQFVREERWAFLSFLALTNSAQAVQEYVAQVLLGNVF